MAEAADVGRHRALGNRSSPGQREEGRHYSLRVLPCLALLDIVLSTVRGKVPDYRPEIRSDIIAIVVGVILYLVFLLGFHPYILGKPIV